MDAHCFLDDGVEVGEVGCGFLVADRVAQFAVFLRLVDLVEELVHRRRVAHKVIENGAQGDGSCVAACDDICGAVDDDIAGVESGRVGFFRCDPFR